MLMQHILWIAAYGLLTTEANEGGKDVHILVITDHFTWYAQAIVTSSQTAKCTAQSLYDKFIVHYGLPEKTLTDQGHNFESDLLFGTNSADLRGNSTT